MRMDIVSGKVNKERPVDTAILASIGSMHSRNRIVQFPSGWLTE